jgi:threonine dehydratase
LITFDDVKAAYGRIRKFIRITPLVEVPVAGRKVLLKLENKQRTRSFKLRGALNAISAQGRLREGEFYTASAGNHGLGAAAAARLLGGRAVIVVYSGASREKIRRIAKVGGRIVEIGRDYDEAEELAMELARKEGKPFLHPFDDPNVIAGQGTVALEMYEQDKNIDQLLVPVGGGGLISGSSLVARTLNPGVEVVGIQPAESPAMVRSLEAKAIIETPIGNTICDALAGRFVSQTTLDMTSRYADRVIEVQEDSIVESMRIIQREMGIIAEPSAAVGIAAILENQVEAQRRTAAIISGGNISKEQFEQFVGHRR